MCGCDCQQGSVMFVEYAIAFIDRFQHADRTVFDGHRHAKQALYLIFDMI
jgi:hypothetical protein